MFARAVLLCALVSACTSSNAVQCSDGRTCPFDTTCDVERKLCITAQQEAACDGHADGDACSFSGQSGVCDRGVCIAAACGNGDLGPDEVCDDGNTASGDGCRGDCKKIEMCGDAEVDDGEACDDGNTNPTDGCDACVATEWTASIVLGNNAASTVNVSSVNAVAVDAAGAFYVVDGNRDRVLRIDSGIVSVVAGTGERGETGDNGPAVNARLFSPSGVVVDGVGNVYISTGQRVRRVDAHGTITTYAGSTDFGFAGDGGAATAAKLNGPRGLAVDGLGNLYIADNGNNRVRRVDAATGIISTVAGNGIAGNAGEDVVATSGELGGPVAVAITPSGDLYIACSVTSVIRRVSAFGRIFTFAGTGIAGFSGDGGAPTAAMLNQPFGVAVSADGSVYIADLDNHRVRRVSSGTITTFAGTGSPGLTGDGGPPAAALLRAPQALAVTSDGTLYIADAANRRVRKVAASVITTVLGNADGTGRYAIVTNGLAGVAADGQGRIYFTDAFHRVRRIDATGTVMTFAGTGQLGYSGDNGSALAATFSDPSRLAFDATGNLIIVDTGNHAIRRVTMATGVVTTIAGTGSLGFSGDGNAATTAELAFPRDAAFDSAGNLYIVDTSNHRIRKVTPGGTITTFAGTTEGFGGDTGAATAAQLAYPAGIAIDAQDNVYVADSANHRVRKITAGTITTFAGSGAGTGTIVEGAQATTQPVLGPGALAVDSQGRLVIAGGDDRSYRVALDGTIRSFAGVSPSGDELDGDGGPATSAVVVAQAMASTASGILVACDTGYVRIVENTGRVISLAGPVDPDGVGPVAQARLADPRAMVTTPTMTLFAGGSSGTVQALDAVELRGVIGRYPNTTPTANLARFRESAFGAVGGVAYDATGNRILLTSGNAIYAVDPVSLADATTWTIQTLSTPTGKAGFLDGALSTAVFDSPTTMFLDAATRQLYVADTGNQVIRKVDLAANTVTTVAGTPRVRGFAGDDGAATSAQLHDPQAVTRCPNGDLFIADTGSHRVRRVSGTTISTVLGDGTASSTGDGTPSRDFTIDTPLGLACDDLNNLYVTSRVALRLLPANDAGIVDGSGGVQTIYGRAPRDTFPASVTSCLTAVSVVDGETLRFTDACSGMLVELHRAAVAP